MKVMVVDDDVELLDLLRFALTRARLEPITIADPLEVLPTYEKVAPDLVVLDINLGGWSGLDLLREIRLRGETPIIMLTGRGAEDDKVQGLQLGADDYVTKPFSHRELIARINAQLRRWGATTPSVKADQVLAVGPLVMDPARHEVRNDGQPVALSVTEFRLLHRLMRDAGTIVPTDVLLRHVWGYPAGTNTDVVRITVHRLRRKLGDDPADPRLIRTVAGVGVMLRVQPTETAPRSGPTL